MQRTIRSRVARAIVVLAIATLAAACASRSAGSSAPRDTRQSPTLNPFVFFEDGGIAFIGVDGRAAQYVKGKKIFPLGVAIANRSKGALGFTRESFVLEDDRRKQAPPASYADFVSGYDRARTDLNLADSFREMMRLRFDSFAFASWPLYPPAGDSATTRDRLDLGRDQYTVTYVYFPVPEGGLHGRSFTLLVKAREVPDPLVVRFRLR